MLVVCFSYHEITEEQCEKGAKEGPLFGHFLGNEISYPVKISRLQSDGFFWGSRGL